MYTKCTLLLLVLLSLIGCNQVGRNIHDRETALLLFKNSRNKDDINGMYTAIVVLNRLNIIYRGQTIDDVVGILGSADISSFAYGGFSYGWGLSDNPKDSRKYYWLHFNIPNNFPLEDEVPSLVKWDIP